MATDTTELLSDSNNIHSSQLQPRKRAKTSEEKEQRRMERILRNRRAAHKSRERKRFYLNLYQEKSEKYDLLFKSILEAGILETSDALKSDTSFNKLKDQLLDLNKKQEKFERENGTVNSSIPKRDQNNSDEEDEESISGESHEQEESANDSGFQDEQPGNKKRKLNSRKDSSSTVYTSNSTTPTTNLPKFEEFVEESNYSKNIISPSNSITTIKNNNDHVVSNHFPTNNKINPLDLSLELGIDLEEPVYNNNMLLDPEVDDLLIMQRYPAVITF